MQRKKKILVTGSCGFIFSNFMRKIWKDGWYLVYDFVSLDKVLAPYNLYNVDAYRGSHRFYMGDIADLQFVDNVFRIERPDIIIHGAAESFVDDSIRKALPFVHSNVLGTQILIDAALKHGIERFFFISTDEVLGQLRPGEISWTEDAPINPRNPYSASKGAGELIVRAAHSTHGLPFNITRCCNNYGPRQPHRNLVPKIISCIQNKTPIPIHGNGQQIREWIHVDDHCSAIMKVLEGPVNEIYNVGSGVELSNIEMTKWICDYLKASHDLISFVSDRPGHDFRYSVDCSKLKRLGWTPSWKFDTGMEHCIRWYLENPWYFQAIC